MKRAKQRFNNFQQALGQLREALKIEKPNFVELAGTIKLFEIAFELGWKTLKDFLEEEGLLADQSISSPRRIIKIAVQSNFLKEDKGRTWLQALENRNMLVHTYNYTFAKQCESEIKLIYYPLLENLSKELGNNLYE